MSTLSIQTTINAPAEGQENENPFVGLRPYEAEESYLFFGRGKQTAELLQKLYTTRFIGVVGSSGCGKSSLIKAGLIPKLKAGFLTNERDRWLTASMRPAGNPLLFLAESIFTALDSLRLNNGEQGLVPNSASSILKTIQEKGTQGIVDILQPLFNQTHCNLLLLVDQFEELFTTKRSDTDTETQMNENVIFVNILLSLSAQKNLPVYVVITMRSDYIGNCNKFYGLPETLNEGQYLVPRLNRQQLNEVTELPIKLSGEKMSARLLDQILNDSDKDLDQLPVLQHALMRTYQFWMQGDQRKAIDFENYHAAGKLDNALSNHANEVYEKLDNVQKKIAELVFKSLTDVNAENVPIRRRQSLGQLTAVCSSIKNSSMQQVEAVINKFRDRDCSFLTPFSGQLKESSIIDISHESLMRQWDKLMGWMNEEQSSGRKFKWLTESVTNNRESLRGIDLKDALAWKQKQPANEEWASRYQGTYQVVQNYIETSRLKARNNKYLRNAIIGIFVLAPLIVFALINQNKNKSLAEKNLLTKNFTDSLERKNRILKDNLLQLDRSLANQKELQKGLQISFNQQQKMTLDKARRDMEAELLKDENERKERQRKQEEIRREEVEILQSSLRREPFYSALNKENEGNTESADAIITALVDSYNKDKKEFTNLRQAITQIFEARRLDKEDPVQGLRLSKKAWQYSQHTIVDTSIIKQIANKLFYNQQILPVSDIQITAASLVISSDKKTFGLNDDNNNIHMGQISNGKVIMEDNFIYSYANSFTPPDTFQNVYAPIKAFSLKGTSVLELDEGGKLIVKSNNKRTEIGTIPGMDKFKLTEFSPDHKYLLTAPGAGNESTLKDSAITLWNLADIKTKGGLSKTIVDRNNLRVKQVSFSPNSRQFFILENNKLKIYSTGKTEPVIVPYVIAAEFAPQGNYIVTISRSGSTTAMFVKDSVGATTKFRRVKMDNNDIKYLAQLRSFSLSPDWKKIMFKQENKISILEREDGDSILQVTSSYSSDKLKLNSAYATTEKISLNTTSFIDSNSILSVDNKGRVSLWKVYPEFKKAEEAFKNIQLPELTIAERLEDGSLTLSEIQSSEKEHELREAATYLENKYHDSEDLNGKNATTILNNTKALYKKLINKTEGEKRLYYIDRFTSISGTLLNPTSHDSTEQKRMAEWYGETVQVLEQQKKNYPSNKALLLRLSEDYNELAYHRLYIRQYAGAIEACLKGLAVDPDNKILYTNLALGYLLSKDFSEADRYYNLYKDSLYDGTNTFRDGFLQDFDDFERAGVITKKNNDVYEKVMAIRKMLEALDPGKNATPFDKD